MFDDTPRALIAFMLQILPLFLILWAINLARGLTGQLAGAVSNFSKKGLEAIKGNPDDPTSLCNSVPTKAAHNFQTARKGVDNRWNSESPPISSGGTTREKLKIARAKGLNAAGRVIGGGPRQSERLASAVAAADKIVDELQANGDDTSVRASSLSRSSMARFKRDNGRYRRDATGEYWGDGAGQWFDSAQVQGGALTGHGITKDNMGVIKDNAQRYKTEGGVEQWQSAAGQWHSGSAIRQANSRYGSLPFQQAAFKHVLKKAADSDDGVAQDRIARDFVDSMNDQGMEAGNAYGTWQGVSIPFQAVRPDLRRMVVSGERGNLQVSEASAESTLNQYNNSDQYPQGSQGVGFYPILADKHEEARAEAAAIRQNATLAARGEQRQLADGSTRAFSAKEIDLNYADSLDRKAENAYANLGKFVGQIKASSGGAVQAASSTTTVAQASLPIQGPDGLQGQQGYAPSNSAAYQKEVAAMQAFERMQRHAGTHPDQQPRP